MHLVARASYRRTLWVLLGLLVSLPSGHANADRIGELANNLSRSSDSKIRISAALSLAKSPDSRAVEALIGSLRKDKDSTIRRIAANTLGKKLQKDGVPKKFKKKALYALKRAQRSDRNPGVRSSAQEALRTLSKGAQPQLLVGIAPTKTVARGLSKKSAQLIHNSVRSVIVDTSPASIETAPGVGMPGSGQIAKAGGNGYAINPTVTKLLIRHRRGDSRSTVQCELAIRVAPWSASGERWSAGESATITGKGSVVSSRSRSALRFAQEHCLEAVASEITATKVVPFLTDRL